MGVLLWACISEDICDIIPTRDVVDRDNICLMSGRPECDGHLLRVRLDGLRMGDTMNRTRRVKECCDTNVIRFLTEAEYCGSGENDQTSDSQTHDAQSFTIRSHIPAWYRGLKGKSGTVPQKARAGLLLES